MHTVPITGMDAVAYLYWQLLTKTTEILYTISKNAISTWLHLINTYSEGDLEYTDFQYSWVFVNIIGKQRVMLVSNTTLCWIRESSLKAVSVSIRCQNHSPLGDHEEVRVIDLGMSKVSVPGKTPILNFLKGKRKRVSEYLHKQQDYKTTQCLNFTKVWISGCLCSMRTSIQAHSKTFSNDCML